MSVDESGSDDVGGGFSYDWDVHYQIIQCLGCKTLSFRQSMTNSEDIAQTGENEWEYVETEFLFPNRTEGRGLLKDYHILPEPLQKIYVETISSLNTKQPILSGIGIRAILDTVCRDKSAEGKDLYNKINYLVSIGALTKDGAEILHKLRNLGNDAAHNAIAHSSDQLVLAMDVIEHLLQGAYILPHHAKKTFVSKSKTRKKINRSKNLNEK